MNQAVNNLLSREDDDGEGSHDEGGGGLLTSGGQRWGQIAPGLSYYQSILCINSMCYMYLSHFEGVMCAKVACILRNYGLS